MLVHSKMNLRPVRSHSIGCMGSNTLLSCGSVVLRVDVEVVSALSRAGGGRGGRVWPLFGSDFVFVLSDSLVDLRLPMGNVDSSIVIDECEWLLLEGKTLLSVDAHALAGIHVVGRHFLNSVIKRRGNLLKKEIKLVEIFHEKVQ